MNIISYGNEIPPFGRNDKVKQEGGKRGRAACDCGFLIYDFGFATARPRFPLINKHLSFRWSEATEESQSRKVQVNLPIKEPDSLNSELQTFSAKQNPARRENWKL